MSIRNFAIKTLSSFFYVGYLPLIPGTFGSLAGLIVFYSIKDNYAIYSLVVLGLLILGLLFAGRAEQVFKTTDPKCVVIDEVVGMLLALAFLPYDIKLVIIGFFLFRILDMLKPYPAGWLERLHGASGIMGDDIVAGLYTNIILQVAVRLVSFTAS